MGTTMAPRAKRAIAAVLATAALAGVTACSGFLSPPATPHPGGTADPIAGLTLEQKVGQLFIVGTPANHLADTAYAAIKKRYVGGIFLSGSSEASVDSTAELVRSITSLSTSTIPMFVATDQEGGLVQVLTGSGFSTIPSALEQGKLDPSVLQTDAQQWGSELAKAGVNLDLAPVADVVRSASSDNAPIGQLQREYGFTTHKVGSHAGAFVAGMSAAGVQTTLKHFPGLGYVRGNTDTESGVTDTVTSSTGPTVASFAKLIDDGAPLVMVSSAIYKRMDPGVPAVFSSKVVTDLLRTKVGFTGIIISDDLSAATQVTGYKPGDRAIRAIRAGVDVLLVSRTPSVVDAMMDAVIAKAKSDPTFAAKVDAAARVVVSQKVALGISN